MSRRVMSFDGDLGALDLGLEISTVLYGYPQGWPWPPPPAVEVRAGAMEACFILRHVRTLLGLRPDICATYTIATSNLDDLVPLCQFALGQLPRFIMAG